MKKLCLISTMMLWAACTVYGQEVAQYRGTTSQDHPVQFVITTTPAGRCVEQIIFTIDVTCPSDATATITYGLGGCVGIQRDGSFDFTVEPVDGGPFALNFAGALTSAGTVEGNLSAQVPLIRLTMEVGAQLCDSGDVTWTARRVREAGRREPQEPQADEIIQRTDKKTGNVITIYKSTIK